MRLSCCTGSRSTALSVQRSIHTGIDLIARNPNNQELMGISVKSRSRTMGAEDTNMRIPGDNFVKAARACEAFACIPYFAIVVDAGDMIRAFLLPMTHLRELAGTPSGANWKMSERHLSSYYSDPQIKVIELRTSTPRWWPPQPSLSSMTDSLE